MTPDTWDIWNKIEDVIISPSGQWVSYSIKPGKGDETLCLYNTQTKQTTKFERAHNAKFDFTNKFIAFQISPHIDTINKLKKEKVKKDKMPKDTMGIYSLMQYQFDKIPDVDSYKMPEKGGGSVALKLHKRSSKKDTTLVKDEGKENGTQLFVYNDNKNTIISYPYTLDYEWSKFNNQLMVHSTGKDSIQNNTISIIDYNTFEEKSIFNHKGKYSKFRFNEQGDKLAFILDRDTTKIEDRPYELMMWNGGDYAKVIATTSSDFLKKNWTISDKRTVVFSENNNYLYFGSNPIPPKADTTILDSEKAKVEIWNYQDQTLYTQQNVRLKRDLDKSYLVRYDIQENSFKTLTNIETPDVDFNYKHSGNYTVTSTSEDYKKYISWLGYAFKDLYVTNHKDGRKRLVSKKIQGDPKLSPSEKYISWYSRIDTSWMSYNVETRKLRKLTEGKYFYELHDAPSNPRTRGLMAWENDDTHMYFYDDYDIYKINPNGESLPQKITNGRKNKIRYSYIKIDREVRSLPSDTTVLLKTFSTKNKKSGYAFLNLKSGKISEIENGKFDYTSRIVKAQNSDEIIFKKASFDNFPNLILSDTNFKNQEVITDANPQQKDYAWGSIELFEWKDGEGKEVQGLIAKPDNFDPNKKYPLIVNFYERSSDRLYLHRAPFPGRSTINYTYWTNKGYVIFNPDVRYDVGYPGNSCYRAVMSGVDALLEKGYVDEKRMGLQGHSWGGYQIADLLTKTERFACAESGAPVVNMISAYGGIRWGSGMSRQFQYEKTQSRLGATLWENPDLYLENSPVFNLDKVTTPVLILHNDDDGAVPWYQGIEYFVGLRRLGKPTWLLNYNDEPHWPVKRPNRIDFNKRLEQFFDHYLMNKPMPVWMKKGVPAVERAYNDGFQIDEK